MGKIIAITGLDGSGTTTVAEALHNADQNSILIKNPIEPFNENRELIDSRVRDTSPVSHYLYYLAANIYTSSLIKQNYLTKNCNVYLVRYLIDTVVSHRALGVNVSLQYENSLYQMIKPDITFFLSVGEETRQERMAFREKSYLDKKLDDNDFRNRLLDEFGLLADQFIVIDNTKDLIYVIAEIQNYMRSE